MAEADVGKVIGRQGRIARALRTVVRASAARERRRVLLEMPITFQGVKLDNIEAITWGKTLPNGNRTLVLAADNNFTVTATEDSSLFTDANLDLVADRLSAVMLTSVPRNQASYVQRAGRAGLPQSVTAASSRQRAYSVASDSSGNAGGSSPTADRDGCSSASWRQSCSRRPARRW